MGRAAGTGTDPLYSPARQTPYGTLRDAQTSPSTKLASAAAGHAMRLVAGLIGVLLVAFIVLSLGRRQVQAHAPAPAASGAAAAANLPQQVQQDVQKALDQGMRQRASDAAP